MTNPLPRGQALALGAIVVAGLGLAAAGLFAVGDRQQLWQRPFYVQVKLPNAGGIEVGSRVRVQGVNAGQVDAIQEPAVRGGDVVLRLRLDARYQNLLGSDARAEVRSEGLIGGKVVEIAPGSPTADPLTAGA